MKIVIIPARGGSKRIKNKNIMDFFGKPMIAYALETATKAGIFDKIHVSTDSDEIRETVEDLGFTIDFMRLPQLADDVTGLIPVFQSVLEQYRSDGLEFEDVCGLMPTCPLIEPADIVKAYDKYVSFGRQHPLHVVASFPAPIEWGYRRDKDGMLTPVAPGRFAARSQDLQKAYYETGPFSFFHISHLLTETPASDESFTSIILPTDKAVDVDDAEHLRIVEFLFLGRLVHGNKELLDAVLSSRTL